jgi:ribose 5-phosphate isomerase A
VDTRDTEKRAAGEAAAELVEDGMTLGLGTGSTAAFFLLALARRGSEVRCVATSAATEAQAAALGIRVEPFEGAIESLDLAVDGAAAAERFVVIVSPDKLIDRAGPPVPLELFRFGLSATLRRLSDLGPVALREAPATPDGGVVADYRGSVDDPAALAAALSGVPGVVDHGLFPPSLVSWVLVGHADGSAERLVRQEGQVT